MANQQFQKLLNKKLKKYDLLKPIVENGFNLTYLAIISNKRDSFSWITRRSTKETLFYPHIVLYSWIILYFISQHSDICFLEIFSSKEKQRGVYKQKQKQKWIHTRWRKQWIWWGLEKGIWIKPFLTMLVKTFYSFFPWKIFRIW